MAETLFQCDDALWMRSAGPGTKPPGAVLRDLVRLDVKRFESRKARSDEVIDERLFVRFRLFVAEALTEAQDRAILQAALARARPLALPRQPRSTATFPQQRQFHDPVPSHPE